MTPRRVGAAGVLVVVLLLVVGAWPAQAAAPSGGITSPASNAVLTTTTPTISGSYSMPSNGKVDEVSVVVQSAEGHGSWSKNFPGNGGSTLSFSYTLPALAYNGRYRAQSQATGTDAIETNGPESSPIAVRDFSVAVPPAQPTGLRSTSNTAKQQVSLTWNANPEPDMLGYEVQRQEGGKSTWTAIDQTANTSAVDTVPKPGEWKYRVVAIRAGANAGEGVVSEPSASTTTTVAPPPTTTTTTTKSGGGSGGSTGGSAGGSSNGSSGEAGTGSSASGGGSAGRTGSNDRALARAGRVDLSGYAALLDANRRQLQTTPTTEYDPGYDENLPFRPVEGETAEPEGSQSVEIGFTETRVTDEAAERKKMAYFAGSLLAFVLAMHGWFLRGEIRRHEELEALALGDSDGGAHGSGDAMTTAGDRGEQTDDAASARAARRRARAARVAGVGAAEGQVLSPEVLSTPAAARARRRARREQLRSSGAAQRGATGAIEISSAPIDGAGTVAEARGTQGGRRARRAARGVPSRLGHDPSEGGSAVRARRRGAGGGDRRPAV